MHKYPYGIIGNCAYMAHIDTQSNIGWMCWPKFDSSFIFGGMMDTKKGGEFSIRPCEEKYESRQYYIVNTNILCTEFTTAEGAYRVTDLAPRFMQYERYFSPLMLIRKIEPIGESSLQIQIKCEPTSGYGKTKYNANIGSNHIKYTNSSNKVRLHAANIPLNYIISERPFTLSDTIYLALSWEDTIEDSLTDLCERFLRRTRQYWEEWVHHASIPHFYQEEVIRSALTLKLHQYYDTGAIIASGTTSLPESPGSERNWDYRYCWLRDAHYTLAAFNHLGHFEELERFVMYIQNIAIHAQSGYAPVFSILGDSKLEEIITDLSGYMDNAPVRVGNQAATHVQNDVYGQILVSLLPCYVDKRLLHKNTKISIQLIYNLLHNIESRMDESDAGLWEYRNKLQLHCYTYLFHWAGSCAGEKIAQELKDDKMLELASRLRRESQARIEKCYEESHQAYTQAMGSSNMDASLLQLITMRYLDPNSETARSHLKRLEKELKTEEGLFYRYVHEDDFGKPEVTFLVCAFWYVDALACVGRVDEAVRCFENLLKYSNHLGLFSEDVDAKTGSQWGNFPQTYSHVGLVNSAFRISGKLDQPIYLSRG